MTKWLIADGGAVRGRFIVFEGLDGAGTTTQMTFLANWLFEQNVAVETTKEPTSGPFGGVIRQALDKRISLDAETLALAFATDRSDHVKNPIHGINKILLDQRWVLCDRYLFSSLAYQSAAGISAEWILKINQPARSPDLTIFVDTDAEVCMERIHSRSSHDELFHDQAVLQKTRSL
jgi:dTMP kinase